MPQRIGFQEVITIINEAYAKTAESGGDSYAKRWDALADMLTETITTFATKRQMVAPNKSLMQLIRTCGTLLERLPEEKRAETADAMLHGPVYSLVALHEFASHGAETDNKKQANSRDIFMQEFFSDINGDVLRIYDSYNKPEPSTRAEPLPVPL